MKTFRFQPIVGRIEEIVSAVLAAEEITACKKEEYAIHLVCEEIIANIVSYAYPDGMEGYLFVQIDKEGTCLTLEFRDGGVPFDPLQKGESDITLPLEEREIGGLGIFLTKKMMDSVVYERVNDENVLTLKKRINDEK